jgi:SAM-dependent methyltransferase
MMITMEAPDHRPVRLSYDTVAEKYAAGFRDELTHKPLDRALLTALVEQTEPGTPIADLGCGPGHVAAWLASRGVSAVGVDLSAAMVALAREEYPSVEFREGDLLRLPAADGEFGAVVALYSIIHLPPGELPLCFAEMHRVLRPGGLAFLSFHIGSEVRHFAEWLGHSVDVDFHFFEVPDVVAAVEAAGFAVEAQVERVHYPEEVETRRAYVMARRL